MTRQEAQKIFDEKFSEIGFDSAFENVGGYIGAGECGYSFYAFDGWKEVFMAAEDVDEDDPYFDDETYVSGEIRNGQKYLIFRSGSMFFVVELAELKRQMFEDLRTLESC